MNIRKNLRRYLAVGALQSSFRLLYRIALVGMNYGGAGSSRSAGDDQALHLLRSRPQDKTRELVVFDVGANIGSYVAQVLQHVGDPVAVHAFEPSAAAFTRLQAHVGGRPSVHLVQAGIGASPGDSYLFSAVPGSVLATTYANPLEGDVGGEPINIITLDAYCLEHSIKHIDLLKLDLEGGELDALRGAQRLIASDAIAAIQFEFGEPSIGSRTFFLDLFQMLAPRYTLYRVLPHGLQRLDRYDATLEVFMSTNYLALSRARFTANP